MKPEANPLSKIDPDMATVSPQNDLRWYDARHLTLEGRAWDDTSRPYERLPARAEGIVRPEVWHLSKRSAGLCFHFMTDADRIAARWTLTGDYLSMDYMPATGASGLDLYTRVPDLGWRWLGVGRPTELGTNEKELVSDIPGEMRAYRLYLPLFNETAEVSIGIPPSATLAQTPSTGEPKRPIVFYGTSIVHGACASRPGMTYPSILGRWLDWPTVNLGFSGNGQMEPEVGTIVAEIDAAAFVIDCLPNVSASLVTKRTAPLVRTLRAAHPETPILLVESITYQNGFLVSTREDRVRDSNQAYRAAYEELLAEGIRNVHYVPGADLLGHDGEATVDGVHPTDVGFLRMAEVLRPALAKVLAD